MKFEICIGTFSITWLKKKGKGKRIYNVMTRNFLGVKIFALRFQRDSKRKNWKRASQVLSRPRHRNKREILRRRDFGSTHTHRE